MYDETAAGGRGGRALGGGDTGIGGAARAERVSRVPKERRALGDCVRQLFTTISLNRPSSSSSSPRPLCREASDRRVSTYRDLGCSLSGLFSVVCDETTPSVRPVGCAASRYYGKGAYLRRCAHITPADKLASLSSSCLSALSPPPSPSLSRVLRAFSYSADFSGPHTPPLFLQSP